MSSWFYLLKEQGVVYGDSSLHLQADYLYFVVEGIVIVRSKEDMHIHFICRQKGCLNIEVLAMEEFGYEYISVGKVRILKLHRSSMQSLFTKYPKLMGRILRQEKHVLDQMIWFSKVYRAQNQQEELRKLYMRLRLPFSYEMFQKYVFDDILSLGVDSNDT